MTRDLDLTSPSASSYKRIPCIPDTQNTWINSIPIPETPSWDINGDHVCNLLDVGAIGLRWNQTGTPGWIPEDVNRDGRVDILDVSILGLHWGQRW
jgi:hypothetical protein